MSCSINRYKSTNTGTSNKVPDTAVAKEMEARMKEMLAVREAQDGGNFKVRPSWDTAAAPSGAADAGVDTTEGTALHWGS